MVDGERNVFNSIQAKFVVWKKVLLRYTYVMELDHGSSSAAVAAAWTNHKLRVVLTNNWLDYLKQLKPKKKRELCKRTVALSSVVMTPDSGVYLFF